MGELDSERLPLPSNIKVADLLEKLVAFNTLVPCVKVYAYSTYISFYPKDGQMEPWINFVRTLGNVSLFEEFNNFELHFYKCILTGMDRALFEKLLSTEEADDD